MKNCSRSIACVIALSFLLLIPSSVWADHSRFWSFYNPETAKLGSKEWWNDSYAFGRWWGARDALYKEGVDFSLTYTNNIAGNPAGGLDQGFTYTDNTLIGAAFDMEKLVGWNGATFTVSGLNRAGSSLSQDYIGNQFTVQQVYGGQTAMFYALILEQKLLDDRLALKAGRFAAGDDFASSPIYWLYMNNGIDGNPQAVPVNAQFSAYPWAVWAARLKAKVTSEIDVMVGAYQVSNRVFNPAYHGLDWSIRPDDGILLVSQIGWSPEFFKQSVPAPSEKHSDQDGKSLAGKSMLPMTEQKGLPGHYWFGAYYSPWQYPQFGTTQTAGNGYGFYWNADQMVYQESPGSDQGLTLWSAFVLSPQENISKVPFQANGGVVYKGLIPARDQDYSVFGVAYGQFSRDYAATQSAINQGNPGYELVLEWGYRLQVNQFLYVQPDIQWVINPGGRSEIPNALVLGAQMGVTF